MTAVSADKAKVAATIIRHLAVQHARGEDHNVYRVLETCEEPTLQAMRMHVEFLAEAIAAVQRRLYMTPAEVVDD